MDRSVGDVPRVPTGGGRGGSRSPFNNSGGGEGSPPPPLAPPPPQKIGPNSLPSLRPIKKFSLRQ